LRVERFYLFKYLEKRPLQRPAFSRLSGMRFRDLLKVPSDEVMQGFFRFNWRRHIQSSLGHTIKSPKPELAAAAVQL
jgi:hypothetical protein